MTKSNLLDELYSRYRSEFDGKEIVLGAGNPDSSILLIGEAPGKDEVRLSKPFVGMAGKNLEEFLGVLEIPRQSIYITNAIKFRLSKINEKTGRVVNRPATIAEINNNIPYLHEEISIINPEHIVTLGNVPLRAVMNDKACNIGNVHGEAIDAIILNKEYKVFPLYHPASIIYNQSLKEVYIKDIKSLKGIINRNTP